MEADDRSLCDDCRAREGVDDPDYLTLMVTCSFADLYVDSTQGSNRLNLLVDDREAEIVMALKHAMEDAIKLRMLSRDARLALFVHMKPT